MTISRRLLALLKGPRNDAANAPKEKPKGKCPLAKIRAWPPAKTMLRRALGGAQAEEGPDGEQYDERSRARKRQARVFLGAGDQSASGAEEGGCGVDACHGVNPSPQKCQWH